jgi:hypothetical protein
MLARRVLRREVDPHKLGTGSRSNSDFLNKQEVWEKIESILVYIRKQVFRNETWYRPLHIRAHYRQFGTCEGGDDFGEDGGLGKYPMYEEYNPTWRIIPRALSDQASNPESREVKTYESPTRNPALSTVPHWLLQYIRKYEDERLDHLFQDDCKSKKDTSDWEEAHAVHPWSILLGAYSAITEAPKWTNNEVDGSVKAHKDLRNTSPWIVKLGEGGLRCLPFAQSPKSRNVASEGHSLVSSSQHR